MQWSVSIITWGMLYFVLKIHIIKFKWRKKKSERFISFDRKIWLLEIPLFKLLFIFQNRVWDKENDQKYMKNVFGQTMYSCWKEKVHILPNTQIKKLCTWIEFNISCNSNTPEVFVCFLFLREKSVRYKDIKKNKSILLKT